MRVPSLGFDFQLGLGCAVGKSLVRHLSMDLLSVGFLASQFLLFGVCRF